MKTSFLRSCAAAAVALLAGCQTLYPVPKVEVADTAMPQAAARTNIDPSGVGTSVRHDIGHPIKDTGFNGALRLLIEKSRNAAHT